MNYGKKLRKEYKIIVDWVKEGSSVIDLGCGDGTLLSLLESKNVYGYGLDISTEYIGYCELKRITALQKPIDKLETYKNIKSNVYDFAICNVTLQMVNDPITLLSEMFRISKNQIISFPNFAKWNNRFELLFKGVMPKHMLGGYNWYDTGHIHQLSIKDFEDYIKDRTIVKKHFLPSRVFPNLLTHTAIYWLK